MRGGYDESDRCNQTCVKEEIDDTNITHRYLLRDDKTNLDELEVTKMRGEVAAFFAMG
jgi:hypothetical protein